MTVSQKSEVRIRNQKPLYYIADSPFPKVQQEEGIVNRKEDAVKIRWFLLLLAGFVMFSCGPSQATVEQAIEEANTCTQTSDCVNLGSHCPFGCNVLVHTSKESEIRTLIQRYNSGNAQCAYDCIAIQGIACKNNKCITLPRP